MKDMKDATSQLRPWPHVSSDWGQAHLELGISTPPAQAEESLPERYGVPQLEVLIVDPEYLFLCWEISEEQIQQARQQFGQQLFQSRRLVAVVENSFGSALAEYELYGEQGRWFIRHTQFGEQVRIRLMFKSRKQTFELYLTGLVQLPRVIPVEPDYYQEIEVIYGIGSKGQLVLKGILEDSTAPWPSISLELPDRLYAGQPESDSGASESGGTSPTGAWWPSSAGRWPTSWPNGRRFAAGEPVSPVITPGSTSKLPKAGGSK